MPPRFCKVGASDDVTPPGHETGQDARSMNDPSFLDAFKHDPLVFVGCVFVGTMSLLVGLIALATRSHRTRAKRGLGAVAAVGGVVALAMGIAGWMSHGAGLDAVLATPGLSPADIERLRHASAIEGRWSLIAGAMAGVPPLLIGLVAAWLTRASPALDDAAPRP
jgi:hypothetical protein